MAMLINKKLMKIKVSFLKCPNTDLSYVLDAFETAKYKFQPVKFTTKKVIKKCHKTVKSPTYSAKTETIRMMQFLKKSYKENSETKRPN